MPRNIGSDIISPADGKVIYASDNKIAIFMSLFDMHVNLMPYDGKIVEIHHYRGEHKPAYSDVSKNERMEIEIDSSIGKIKLIQIAGIFARRIIPYVKEGEYVKKGDKIGIIRFGSRVEMYLPERCEIIVSNGQKIKAGQTVARIQN
jgi:phosphatidylserine decarboxylase